LLIPQYGYLPSSSSSSLLLLLLLLLLLHTHFGTCTKRQSVVLCVVQTKVNIVHPRTTHEGREVEYRYSSTFSLTSALDRVGGQRHAPAALPPGKT
jgi:hypothetical protein